MKDTKQIRVMRALAEAGSGIRFHYWDREDVLQAMRRCHRTASSDVGRPEIASGHPTHAAASYD